MTDFSAWMSNVRQDVEKHLDSILPGRDVIPSGLHEAMRYSVLGGGKRVRALLVFAAGELSIWKPAHSSLLECAAAVELIHAYSLIHDDLPCMDDDPMRRGRPACHVAFGEATALLAGDALQSLAFECLSRMEADGSHFVRADAIRTLAHASGSLGMAGGQAIDLASVGKALTRPELEQMHLMKTGALIRASITLGALCCNLFAGREGGEARGYLNSFAINIGLLFQVIDDILDRTEKSSALGKTAGKDEATAKPTYVSLLGLDEARRYADELRKDALLALAPFGDSGRRLTELTDFILERRF
ncbi:MAG: polyprenyl synthetase family protein [Betaproteobacteria bacterium]|nr:polyprenyl synthetase family protein [Betaproteobacteria bacterium]